MSVEALPQEFVRALTVHSIVNPDVLAALSGPNTPTTFAADYLAKTYGVGEKRLVPLMLSAAPALGALAAQANKPTDIDFVDVTRPLSIPRLRRVEQVVGCDSGWRVWSARNPAYREGDVHQARTLGVALLGDELRQFAVTPGLELGTAPATEDASLRVLRTINGGRTDQDQLLSRPTHMLGPTANAPVIFHGLVSFARDLMA